MNITTAELKKKAFLRRNAIEILYKMLQITRFEEKELESFLPYIERQDFLDFILERSLDPICGNPFCTNTELLKEKAKYKIDNSKQKLYLSSELEKFCSVNCYEKTYSRLNDIPEVTLWLRPECQALLQNYDFEHDIQRV